MQAAGNDEAIDREEQKSGVSPGAGKGETLTELGAVARVTSEPPAPFGTEPAVPLNKSPIGWRPAVMPFVRAMARRLATFTIFLIAVLVCVVVWDQYVIAPWTRDGRVRVQVANVAPQVSGQITQLLVADNQFVHKGDVLYRIAPLDFEVALRLSKALLEQRKADSYVKEMQSERRNRLSILSTTPEEQQVFEGSARQANAAVEAAREQVAQAQINLQRTVVRSPVNGYVTNLLLRTGDYAHTGVSDLSIVDTDSYWVDGYFEETKLAQICVGDRAEVELMGYSAPIIGHVAAITRGISVSNATTGAQGLPDVDPIYTWVRLAQRVPVRIAIDSVPPGLPLVSGMTGTVTLHDDTRPKKAWFGRATTAIETSLSHLTSGVSARPGCIAPNS